ncbi:MAG: hypothetical protein M1450_05120 [Patescibacteria group bacterium]|nr:hypothetical protein [Patescibacteria group bacterium]
MATSSSLCSNPLKVFKTETIFSLDTPERVAVKTAAETFSRLCFPGSRTSFASITFSSFPFSFKITELSFIKQPPP